MSLACLRTRIPTPVVAGKTTRRTATTTTMRCRSWIRTPPAALGVMVVPPPTFSPAPLLHCVGSAFPVRSLSSSPSSSSSTSSSSYYAQKRERKERRIRHHEVRKQRQERLPMRRAGYKNELRQAFRRFFIRKKVDEEYMERKARQAGLGWNLSVAVLLERQCIVMPDMEDWEIDMENLQAHLGKYGKMYPKELLNMDEEVDVDDIAITNEELLALLPEGFVPAPRETPADASGDVRTTERKLKTSVYLAVQSGEDDSSSSNNNNNNKDLWQFPTVAVQEDETLLEAAKRALATQIGPEVEYWTPSNCPCAVDMVALPEEDRAAQGVYGTKTFFMKVTYSDGQVDPSTMKVKDYAWLDRGEVTERVKDQQGDNAASFYHYLL